LFLKSSQGQTHEENNAKFLHNQDPKGLIMFVTICRLYESYDDANLTIRDLKAEGVPLEDTGIVSNNSDNWYSPDSGKSGDSDLAAGSLDHDAKRRNDHDGRLEAAGVGAAIGATAGTAAGLLTLLAIPGVGPIVGLGWLLPILGGAAIGGVTGGIVGALTRVGVSEEDAQVYAEGVRRGGTLVTARVPPADARRVESVMDRLAVDIQDRRAEYLQSGWRSFDSNAAPYNAEQVRSERNLHSAR
jgi:hypothetical protein